jgi:hypothetical protein
MKRWFPLLSLLLCAPMPTLALSYVESSQGLIPPSMDGGRTELELADVDLDGNVDIVSIGDHGSPYVNTDQHGIMVWFGDGRGNWAVQMAGNFGYGGIAIGDIDNDGRMDAAYAMHHDYGSGDFGDQLIEAALGDGTGRNWTPWDDGLATAGEDWGMFGTDLADIDNDGSLDVGSNSFGCCAGAHVYRNNRDGTWSPTWGFLGGNSGMDFLFGDIDNDGFIDLAVSNQTGTVYRGDGTGGFTNADGNLPAGGSSGRGGIALGDVDNDGDLDISFKVSGVPYVYLWNGPGVWINASTGLPTSGVAATQLADMDGDGWLDLIAIGNGIVRIWLGDGGSSWTLAATWTMPAPGDYSAMRAGGDVDHNGRPDLALVTAQGSYPTYINHLRVYKETTVPTELAVRFTSPRGGERFPGGSVRFIDWMAAVPGIDATSAEIDLSTAGPSGPWMPVAAGLTNGGRYQWRIPVLPPTSEAYLRIRVSSGADVVEAITPRPFSILPPTAASVDAPPPVAAALVAVPNPTGGAVRLSHPAAPSSIGILRVLDAGGRLVRIFDPPAEVWDGRDGLGRTAPSGIYFLSSPVGTVSVLRLTGAVGPAPEGS